jgi:hypothetical protein
LVQWIEEDYCAVLDDYMGEELRYALIWERLKNEGENGRKARYKLPSRIAIIAVVRWASCVNSRTGGLYRF